MEFEQALKLVDDTFFAKKNRHLSDPEMTILQGTWQGLSYDEMAANSQYSVNYLMRDVGPNLWRSLSEVLAEKVNKSNCRAILTRYQTQEKTIRETAIATQDTKQNISPIRQHQDWGEAPDLAAFYGRTEELKTLEHWVIQERCRLICIWGMGGIGKTSLSRQFVERVKGQFDYLFWRSLRNKPSIPDLLTEILQLFYPRASLGNRGISQVLFYLKNYRCLLIFDNIETILQQGEELSSNEKGYTTYRQFFKQVGETENKSCLLLNSQEKLREIIPLESSTPLVHSLELSGLSGEEATELFNSKKLIGKKSWQDFVELYQGNPLALNLIIATIQKFFNGDVAKYMKLKATYLPSEIANILQERFATISQRAIDILIHLAHSSQPVSLLEIQEIIFPNLEISETIAAIESLQGRSLIELEDCNDETKFKLQPVVKKYVKKYYSATR